MHACICVCVCVCMCVCVHAYVHVYECECLSEFVSVTALGLSQQDNGIGKCVPPINLCALFCYQRLLKRRKSHSCPQPGTCSVIIRFPSSLPPS